MSSLDDPSRGQELSHIIRSKPALYRWYCEIYSHYAAVLSRCPQDGLAVELGAGGGFAKEVIPELMTADVLPYSTVDLVFDACHMPFADQTVRFLCLLNVFHHIPDVALFLSECQRCLMPGGRILIVDQFPGWISHWILKYVHHEPFHPEATQWNFPSKGPLSGANGALAWIVFFRDRGVFSEKFPQLMIQSAQPHTPLRYWLSGGLKSWSLIPAHLWGLATLMDRFLIGCSQRMGSFIDIEIVRR